MNATEFQVEQQRPSLLRRLLALVVLLVAAAIALKVIIGFVMAIFWIVVGAVVLVAVLWALKTLVW
jgi:hypothetical protein